MNTPLCILPKYATEKLARKMKNRMPNPRDYTTRRCGKHNNHEVWHIVPKGQ